MKRTQKRIFGFLGLCAVAAMTGVAIAIPTPGASAITDNIQVRVTRSVPDARFEKPTQNITTTNPLQEYTFSYENAESVRMALVYTDKNDVTTTIDDLMTYPGLNFTAGRVDETIDLASLGLGYGKYVFSLFAKGSNGVETPGDAVATEFIPVIASARQNQDDGLVDLSLDSYTGDVEAVDIYLDGQIIKNVVRADFNNIVKLDLGDRPSGNYMVYVMALDGSGDELYKPYPVSFYYENIKVPNTNAPDTGGLFKKLNISREDYLITGLIVFFVFGIVAFGIVKKSDQKKRK